jgi:hypothetical protein
MKVFVHFQCFYSFDSSKNLRCAPVRFLQTPFFCPSFQISYGREPECEIGQHHDNQGRTDRFIFILLFTLINFTVGLQHKAFRRDYCWKIALISKDPASRHILFKSRMAANRKLCARLAAPMVWHGTLKKPKWDQTTIMYCSTFCVHFDGSWPNLKSLPPTNTVSDKYEICRG